MIKKITYGIAKRFVLYTGIFYLVLPFILPSLIYAPIKEQTKAALKVQDIYLKTSDNVKINVWYVKAKNNKPTILFCHGNGGNISYYEEIINIFSDKGYGILLLDYRGYGKSEGTPSETGLYNDIDAALKFLNEKEKLSNNRIVLWGLSLGGAVVSEVASKENFKAVMLQSTFTNVKEEGIYMYGRLAKDKFSKTLIKAFFDNLIYLQKYDTESKIAKISSPLLIAHDIPDEVIPVKMSYELAKLNPKAKLFISKTGSHNDGTWFYEEALKFLEDK
ncbi:MAG: alpha/beta hydrolase [bacterium]